jgi:5-methylcytosine-specific restriction endonuclease McrA
MSGACSRCGLPFTAGATGGRPRSRCDSCRTNHAKIDGTLWRQMRARVLAEEPICVIPGCGSPSTHVDHIVPLARGGDPMDRTNLQGMCGPHNASKGARMWAETSATPRCTCGDPACPGRWHL